MIYKEYFPFDGGDQYNHVKVGIDYQEGGINYANGKTENRGLYIYFMPVNLKREGGFTSESYMLFGGGAKKFCIFPMERRNKKTFAEVVELWKSKFAEIAKAKHDNVDMREVLTLTK